MLDYFTRARAHGFNDPLIEQAFKEVNPDGTENKAARSNRAEVDRLLQAGEKYFGQHDFKKAAEKYAEAFQQEPANYIAAIYVGDAHFAAGDYEEALAWFGRARPLAPDRETAHRYTGDALMRLGRRPEALEHYLDAAVAEPYNAYPWRTLGTYCEATLIKAWTTPRDIPGARIKPGGGGPKLELAEGFNPFDLLYGLARISWQQENLAKRFPAGEKYRLTLEEETSALRTTLKAYRELRQKPAPPAEATAAMQKIGRLLDHLVEIEDAGLLEAHILLVRGDAELAQDYPAYRAGHRQLLRDYLVRFYLHLP